MYTLVNKASFEKTLSQPTSAKSVEVLRRFFHHYRWNSTQKQDSLRPETAMSSPTELSQRLPPAGQARNTAAPGTNLNGISQVSAGSTTGFSAASRRQKLQLPSDNASWGGRALAARGRPWPITTFVTAKSLAVFVKDRGRRRERRWGRSSAWGSGAAGWGLGAQGR